MTLNDKSGGHTTEPGSFRDRENQIFYHDGKVYRALSENALQNWERLAATDFFRRRSDAGDLVQTCQVAPPTGTSQLMLQECLGYLSHKRVPFVSYPYEWSFSMMKDAALLQLDLLLDALDEDMTLKDASSYNVQWEGAKPYFIDIPSFVILEPGEPWVGYHQFCRLFLYPLLLQAHRNLEFQGWLRGGIDGISPEQCANIFTLKDVFRSGVLKDVFLHAKLQRRYAAGSADVKTRIKSAGFNKMLIQANAKRLRKIVAGLSWRGSSTHWKDYNNENSYLAADVEKKEAFVKEVVHSRRWELVWDLGCNTGKYSKIAAVNADYVVAVDSDQTVVDHVFNEVKAESVGNILPLLGNLADPSPNMGWRGLERKSLPERGRPDLVLCLALVHHLVITANIPVREFVDWLAALGGDVVIEFVSKADPMVKVLLANKADIYADYEKPHFERCLADSFEIGKQIDLESGTRFLYFAKAKR